MAMVEKEESSIVTMIKPMNAQERKVALGVFTDGELLDELDRRLKERQQVISTISNALCRGE